MNALVTVIREQFQNSSLMLRLSTSEMNSKYRTHYLGMIWLFLNPVLQIALYWFVFGIGIRAGASVGEIPFFLWLLTGIVTWLFVAPAITQGTRSISSKVNVVSKMNFPMSVLPTIAIVNNLVPYMVMLVIVIGIVLYTGHFSGIYFLQLPYYLFGMVVFLYALNLLMATISIIVRDVQLIVQSIIRFSMFLLPVFWTMENLNPSWIAVLKLNPLFYVLEGVRISMIGDTWFFEDMMYTLYFWSITLFTLWIACKLHVKFRNRFVDLM